MPVRTWNDRRSKENSMKVRLVVAAWLTAAATWAQAPFRFQEVMIPMRDGARLQTVILAPTDQKDPLPILLRRTPYGVPAKAYDQMPPNLVELANDGYIFVIQNLRGRFRSEGVFKLSMAADLTDPKPSAKPPTPTTPSTGW